MQLQPNELQPARLRNVRLGSYDNQRISVKLNMGCGSQKLEGYVNVDHFAGCNPDVVFDLENSPWPWADNSIELVAFFNSLEHLGQQSSVFLNIMRELYRVCCDGATVQIAVPHPRSNNYLNDPTHVRPVTVEMLRMFDRTLNQEWSAKGLANTPLALQIGVDFTIVDYFYVLDATYKNALDAGKMSNEELADALDKYNNVATEIRIQLKVRKDNAKPGAAAPII